ncbi:hypothetical protein [Olleya sp. YS]|uniref:hypothetical protein n=1 Tax=Olleya sp. YS TaxID=3028318 RepID=UPI0024343128|nr:hypothetical protein [Olleya sp. YS]WGD35129.1 hypothetical protein Ollyesu_01645 [Olleya sp. YS]
MKKILLLTLLCVVTINTSFSQEWLTSFELAKRLALSKNKMILAVWEDATYDSYPVAIRDSNGKFKVVELFNNDSIKELVWDYFVPVIIQESSYDKLAKEVVGKRSLNYEERFNDDNLKVMDPNGFILNASPQDYFMDQNLSFIIKNYALNTSSLNPELGIYFEDKNFSTAFRLGVKYQEAAIYANQNIKKDIINLSDIYLEEARVFFENTDLDNKDALTQKLDLLIVKKELLLGKPKKARRLLKKYKDLKIHDINASLFAFLNYTTFTYLKKIDEALLWRDQVQQIDLKKVQFIVN